MDNDDHPRGIPGLGLCLLVAIVAVGAYVFYLAGSNDTEAPLRVFCAPTADPPYVALRNTATEPVEIFLKAGVNITATLAPGERRMFSKTNGLEFGLGREFKVGGEGFRTVIYTFDEPAE